MGWSLERSLASRLATAALEQAIAARHAPVGLVHHSDRGVQYASAEYVAVLEKQGMIPSMSRPANPYDNASCESFLKTLKREEIYANQYSDLEHLRTNIEEFIEKYYNRQRLHSALGYCSPEEFEQQAKHSDSMTQFRSPTIKFFRSIEEEDSTGLLEQGTQTTAVPCSRPHPRLGNGRPKLNPMARVSFKSVSSRGVTPEHSGSKRTAHSAAHIADRNRPYFGWTS